MTIRPYLSLRSFWIGFYWSSRYRRLYVLPLPCIGVTVTLEKKRRRWWWFLSVLLLTLASCAAPVETNSGGGNPPSCTQYLDAQTSCVEVTHYLEGYGCTFTAACNASCPSGSAICDASVAQCEAAADRYLYGIPPSEVGQACQSVASYCDGVLVCEAL